MVISFAPMPIVANKARDAVLVEPAADLVPLVIHGQAAVTAAGTDHDACAAWLLRQIDDQRRFVFRLFAERSGSAARPKQFGLRLRAAGQRETKGHRTCRRELR